MAGNRFGRPMPLTPLMEQTLLDLQLQGNRLGHGQPALEQTFGQLAGKAGKQSLLLLDTEQQGLIKKVWMALFHDQH